MQKDEDKEPLKKLTNRIGELLVVLNRVTEDLIEVTNMLKTFSSASSSSHQTFSPAEIPSSTKLELTSSSQSVQTIKSKFPKGLEELLNFEGKEDYVLVKPRAFLGSENFAKIASIIRDIGGDYVSAGKDSHFRIPL